MNTVNLPVLYEDASLIVLHKPSGLSSEDTPNVSSVPAFLRQRWNDPAAFVGVVHRLDTGVSGLMVYARTPAAAAALSRQVTRSQELYARLDGRAGDTPPAPSAPRKKGARFSKNITVPPFIKEYRAVIAGGPDTALSTAGVLRDYLFKDSRRGKVFAVDRPRKGVREAVLEYEILATASPAVPTPPVFSLVRITLHTGRTHQIRAQFASRKHPLWGDGKYGSRQKGAIALQSARLCFAHPVTGQPMEFTLPLPEGAPWALFVSLSAAPATSAASPSPGPAATLP